MWTPVTASVNLCTLFDTPIIVTIFGLIVNPFPQSQFHGNVSNCLLFFPPLFWNCDCTTAMSVERHFYRLPRAGASLL
jgi:hypothetical protein